MESAEYTIVDKPSVSSVIRLWRDLTATKYFRPVHGQSTNESLGNRIILLSEYS